MTQTTRRATGHWSGQRWTALGALLLVLVLSIALIALGNERIPAVTVHRLLARSVRFTGAPPKLDWPAQGQAAVEVLGIGSLGTSGAQTPVPIASVAKVMTAYLTLQEHPLRGGQDGFHITITGEDVRRERQRAALGESVLPVRSGESIDERQALEALMLPSANNIAALLAEYDAGSQVAFVARMNETAKMLGMSSTSYNDPSGFDMNTVSTAADQLKLARVAIRKPAFAQIVGLSSVDLPVAGEVDNYNALIGEDGYIGIKTGSDRAAGGCLVFAKRVRIAGHRLTVLGAVLGQREGSLIPAALASARALGDSAAGAIHMSTVIPAKARALMAEGADGQKTAVLTSAALKEIGWGGLKMGVKVTSAPVGSRLHSAQPVAVVTVDGPIKVATSAITERSIAQPSLVWRLGHML